MFSFKKARGRQNIRRKETAAEDGAGAEELGDVVKRSVKPRAESRPPGLPGMALGSSSGGGGDGNERTYSRTEMDELKEDSSTAGTPDTGGAYPFAAEGIPDSQQIYMAKKLRRERRAAQAMDEPGVAENNNDDEEDFIRLSDDMEDARLDDAGGARTSDADVSDADDRETGGEDAFDAVIVDKNERAAFNRAARKAMEESIAQAHDSEMSDWESAQLRSAGVPAMAAPASQAPLLPEDGGFEFDGEQLKFMIAQATNQLAADEARLATAKERLAASSTALEELEHNIEHAQRQYDHFLSLAKATSAV
ncbi:hypothetical protein H4R19_002684 [Coemansia spiralis]|nr:hypothetical protein H4R19_002684 [Coemansia spiralis]